VNNSKNTSFLSDINIKLFTFNYFSVMLSYTLAVLTNMASNSYLTPFRTFVLLISLFYLIKNLKTNSLNFDWKNYKYTILFILAIILITFLSIDIYKSFSKIFQFIIPFFYILLFFNYLKSKTNSKTEVLKYLLLLQNITYFIPLIYYVLSGGGFNTSNLYGEETDGFVSNHYGWASLFFILSMYDLITNFKVSKRQKLFLYIFTFLAFYLLLISGNRASYICFIIVFVIYFLYHNTNPKLKYLILFIFIIVLISQYENTDSAIYTRFQKTSEQLENEEEAKDTRTTARKVGFSILNENPIFYITGFGIFSFKEAVRKLEPSISISLYRSGVHNSYLELFFGSGVLIFTMFFSQYIFKPIILYFKHMKNNFLFVLPVFIIPLFESNLTGGQFLFYPWFTTSFFILTYINNTTSSS